MLKNGSSGITDNYIRDNGPNVDGVDRRGFLKCMAWAGTGALCVIKGGDRPKGNGARHPPGWSS